MIAPSRPQNAAWEPEALELPLESPHRPNRMPYYEDDEPAEQARRSGRPSEGERGSHVIVIDMA
jgi:hypothetical protein